MGWSDVLLYMCRNRCLCALALFVLLTFQASVFYAIANHSEQSPFVIANAVSDALLPNTVDVNKGLAAVGIFLLLILSLSTCAFVHLWGEQSDTSRRSGRSLMALTVLYIFGFLFLQNWLQSLKFSAFWASDCSEYAAAERSRLADFATDLKWAKDFLVSRNESSESSAGCRIYIAINAVPNRTQKYLSQTMGSLLRSFSREELLAVCRIEIMSDFPSDELQSIESHRLEPLVVTVYNPTNRQTPVEKSIHSWKQGSILHYLHAMERCVSRQAEYCLVLDDDTLASQGWLSEAMQNIKDLEQGTYGSEGEHWTILKLFQPVWGNQRQNWHLRNSFLLLLLSFMGAIPCGLLAFVCRCRVLTPSLWFWNGAGFVAALYGFWATGKANLDWMVGDAVVHPHGTSHMAQANLFHRARAEAGGFLQHLRNHIDGPFIDLSICAFFNEHRHLGPMWATSPSLFQHGGLMTSLPNKLGQRPCRIRIFHEGVWRQPEKQRPGAADVAWRILKVRAVKTSKSRSKHTDPVFTRMYTYENRQVYRKN